MWLRVRWAIVGAIAALIALGLLVPHLARAQNGCTGNKTLSQLVVELGQLSAQNFHLGLIDFACSVGLLQQNNIWALPQDDTPVAVTDGATVTIDLSQGNDFLWTIGATGRTLANPINGPTGGNKRNFMLRIVNGIASPTITTYGTNWKFPGATKPTLPTSSGAIDVWSCTVYASTGEIDCISGASGTTGGFS